MKPVPIAEIFHDPQTGYFGYRYFYEGRPPHYVFTVYPTLQAALAACDPHGERVWEEASDSDENKILILRSYKPGSVRDLLSRTPPDVSHRKRLRSSNARKLALRDNILITSRHDALKQAKTTVTGSY